VNRVVHRMGMVGVLWDVDSRDSAGAGSEEITANATEGMRPGAIILMHETYDRSLSALPNVLQAARQKGIRLVSVPELLALDPPPEALVRAGPDACSDRERYQQQEDATAMRLGG
jgi:peptidoglycan/xylan/chitin deacetylase (PgdA/CDA1 family)